MKSSGKQRAFSRYSCCQTMLLCHPPHGFLTTKLPTPECTWAVVPLKTLCLHANGIPKAQHTNEQPNHCLCLKSQHQNDPDSLNLHPCPPTNHTWLIIVILSYLLSGLVSASLSHSESQFSPQILQVCYSLSDYSWAHCQPELLGSKWIAIFWHNLNVGCLSFSSPENLCYSHWRSSF